MRAHHLVVPPGVYAPQDDTRLLLRALCQEGVGPGTELLDLGTGTGVLAVSAARLGATVTAVDLALRAVVAARLNAGLARQRVRVRRGDLLSPVPGERYDIVISNPPYVPASSAPLPRHGATVAWDAGPDGRALIDRICDTAPTALKENGVLLMVHSALCGTENTLVRLRRAGLRAEVTDRLRIPYGPVLRSRLAHLVDRGLLDNVRGAQAAGRTAEEELVIIRARPS